MSTVFYCFLCCLIYDNILLVFGLILQEKNRTVMYCSCCCFVVEDPFVYDFLASDACLLYSDKVYMIPFLYQKSELCA